MPLRIQIMVDVDYIILSHIGPSAMMLALLVSEIRELSEGCLSIWNDLFKTSQFFLYL